MSEKVEAEGEREDCGRLKINGEREYIHGAGAAGKRRTDVRGF